MPTELPEQQPHTENRKDNTEKILRLEGGWPSGSEDLLAGGDAVGQRELEILGHKLLDVRAADVGGLLDLNDLENL